MSNRDITRKLNDRLTKPLASSCALLAIIVAVMINQMLVIWHPLSDVDPESLPAAHTWVWWATREFMDKKETPDLVLLGSSLLMHPVSRLDADFLNRDLDYVRHHRSVYMEVALARRFGLRSPYCFNFALPGGMVSDDYMVTRALLRGQRKPRLIVLALCPRDFMDNGIRWCGGTPAFRYLRRFVDIDDLVELAMPQIWQRFEYLLAKGFYLFDKRLDLQVICAETAKRESGEMLGNVLGADASADVCSLPTPPDTRSEVEAGMFIVKAHQERSFADNSAEYKKRYRAANEKIFSIQATFLKKLLTLSKQNGIGVVIVNMPVTAANMQLLPKGTYEAYISVVRDESGRHGSTFIDLNQDHRFEPDDFYDTIHMNAAGGKKFADAILSGIADDRSLCENLGATRTGRYFASQNKGRQL